VNFSDIKASIATQLRPYPTVLGWTRRFTNMHGITSQSLDDYIFTLARRRGKNVFFLQIGANDGLQDDPIHYFVGSYGWRGILMEPVPHLFGRLKENYKAATGLIFLNAALSQTDDHATFFYLRPADTLPPWCEGLGSFRQSVLLSHKRDIPDIESYIVEEPVQCITFGSLISRYQLPQLDLILIDTEGYDLEILRQIDFTLVKPQMIIYEHKHLNESERNEATDLLMSHGFSVRSIREANSVAYRR
jgi:FkbM family methyltransferase